MMGEDSTMHAEGLDQRMTDHIMACDKMYAKIHDGMPGGDCKCKKLLSMGFLMTEKAMSEICILHCQRWSSQGEVPPVRVPWLF